MRVCYCFSALLLAVLSVSGGSDDDGFWWFNVRPSNTEPLLRLNAEAATPAGMERVRDDVLGLIRG